MLSSLSYSRRLRQSYAIVQISLALPTGLLFAWLAKVYDPREFTQGLMPKLRFGLNVSPEKGPSHLGSNQ